MRDGEDTFLIIELSYHTWTFSFSGKSSDLSGHLGVVRFPKSKGTPVPSSDFNTKGKSQRHIGVQGPSGAPRGMRISSLVGNAIYSSERMGVRF